MQCPKCDSSMATVTTEAGTVEQCSACSGLWFDRLEEKWQIGFAERLDTGDAERGSELNKVDRLADYQRLMSGMIVKLHGTWQRRGPQSQEQAR